MGKLKIVIAGLVALAVVGGVAAHEGHRHQAPAPASQVQTVTLEGELVDPQCWFTHQGQGIAHSDCALTCARGGQDLAFLERRSGALYAILAAGHGQDPNDGLFAHIGKPVQIRGMAYQQGGNRGLIVQSVADNPPFPAWVVPRAPGQGTAQ